MTFLWPQNPFEHLNECNHSAVCFDLNRKLNRLHAVSDPSKTPKRETARQTLFFEIEHLRNYCWFFICFVVVVAFFFIANYDLNENHWRSLLTMFHWIDANSFGAFPKHAHTTYAIINTSIFPFNNSVFFFLFVSSVALFFSFKIKLSLRLKFT